MRVRIISGEFKGRYIKIPQSNLIRPITDRIKETLFNILNNRLDFKDLMVLELYAGSGSIGLECISHGAKLVHFVEKDLFIFKTLKENIESLNVSSRTKGFKNDVLQFTSSPPPEKYNLIIADPPFPKDDIYNVIENLKLNGYFDSNPLTIVRRSLSSKENDINHFKAEPFKIIGDSCLYEITP